MFVLFPVTLGIRLVWDFSCFLRLECIAINISLRIDLLWPMDIGLLCFHCHLSLGIFYFPLWFLQWSICCLVTLFSLCVFLFLGFFLVILFNLLACDWKSCLIWFQFSHIWAHFVAQHVKSPGECSMCPWETCVFCCFQMECSVNIN